jgi:hypothetical protein
LVFRLELANVCLGSSNSGSTVCVSRLTTHVVTIGVLGGTAAVFLEAYKISYLI